MTTTFCNFRKYILLAIIVVLFSHFCRAQQKTAETFRLTISLPAPIMHVGDDLVMKVITSNPTDHIVYAGEGYGSGLGVELLNSKGEDVGLHAMGGVSKHPDSGIVLGPTREAIGPAISKPFTCHFKPEPGYLVPGVYKLRVHRRDIGSNVEVYSNAVTLTVVP